MTCGVLAMTRLSIVLTVLLSLAALPAAAQPAQRLLVGFGEINVTPDPVKSTVYLAGFGKNRNATKIHDPLMARAVVFAHAKKKIASVSVDVAGLFNESALNVRKHPPGFDYVVASITPNHERRAKN